jgi:cardiolipin synthase (CMP-forming)
VPNGGRLSGRDLVRIPGLISLARLPLGVVFALTVGNVRLSLAVLLLAGFSDLLDGWYARRFGQATPTGAVLDAVADKLFVATVVVTLVASHELSVIQALLLGVREAGEVIIGARLAAKGGTRLTRRHAPNRFGKVTTALQYAAVAIAVTQKSDLIGIFAVAAAVMGVVATATYWRSEEEDARLSAKPRATSPDEPCTAGRSAARS